MRKVAWITLLAFFCQNLVFANDEDPNAGLKAHVATLKASYQPFVKLSHTNLIRYYFLQRSVDFFQAFFHLSSDLAHSEERFKTITEELKQLDRSMGSDLGQIEQLALKGHFLMSAVEYERSLAEQSLADIEILKAAWEDRCSNQKLAQIAPALAPEYYYIPNKPPSADIAGIQLEVSLGGTYRFGGTGEGFSGSPNIKTAGANEARTVTTTVASHIATGVSSAALAGKKITLACLTSGAATGPGILIGTAVAAVMSTLFASVDVGEVQKSRREQRDLLTEAWMHQWQVVIDEGTQFPSLLKKSCEEVLTGDYHELLTTQHDVAKSYLEQLKKAIQEHETLWKSWKTRFADGLSALEARYFPKVIEEASSPLEEFFASERERNSESRQFLKQKIRPQLEALQHLSQDHFLEEVEMKHRLWDQIIQGESTYNPQKNFYFGRSDGKTPEVKKNRWNLIIQELSTTFAR